MLKSLTTIEDKVKYLLREYPQLRDDDKKLIVAYLNVFYQLEGQLNNAEKGEAGKVWRELFYHPEVPSFEAIRRTRQKIQEKDNTGDFQASQGTQEARKEEESKVKDWVNDN